MEREKDSSAQPIDYIKAFEDARISFDLPTGKDTWDACNLHELLDKSATKTGTTICGCIAESCVVLAADTRSTAGSSVADRHCLKLHHLSDNVWGAGAGVAGDLDHLTANLEAEMQIFARQLGSLPRVETFVRRLCEKLFQYQGYLTTAIIMGGVNPTGEMALYYVSPDGYSHSLPYMAMGSGGYYAMSILEAGYKTKMSREEAVDLCADAIQAGVMNDLASGTGVDVVVIPLDDPQHPVMTRSYRQPVVHQKLPSSRPMVTIGQSIVLKEKVKHIPPFKADELGSFVN